MIKALSKNDVFKNFTHVLTGSIISQVILAITPIFLARYYVPKEFGILATITAFASLLAGLYNFEYLAIINIASDEKEAYTLKKLCNFISIILSIISFLIAFILILLPTYFKIQNLGLFLLLIPIWAFLLNEYQTSRELLARVSQFKVISIANITKSLSIAIIQITFAFIFPKAIFLILGRIIGEIIAILTQRSSYKPNFKVDKNDIKRARKKYFKSVIYLVPIKILDNISKNLFIYILGIISTLEVVGFYTIAMKIVQLPTAMILENMQKVFESRTNKYIENINDLFKLTFKSTLFLFILSLPISLGLYYLSDFIILNTLGANWSTSAQYAKWLAPSIVGLFILQPFVSLYKIQNRLKELLIISTIERVLQIFLTFYIGQKYDVLSSIKAYTFSIIIFSLIKIFYLLQRNSHVWLRWRY